MKLSMVKSIGNFNIQIEWKIIEIQIAFYDEPRHRSIPCLDSFGNWLDRHDKILLGFTPRDSGKSDWTSNNFTGPNWFESKIHFWRCWNDFLLKNEINHLNINIVYFEMLFSDRQWLFIFATALCMTCLATVSARWWFSCSSTSSSSPTWWSPSWWLTTLVIVLKVWDHENSYKKWTNL